MTLEQFAEIYVLLAVQLRATSDADEATIRCYYDALKDLAPELLAIAGHELARTAQFFPKTSEWREAVAAVTAKRKAELESRLRKLPAPLCKACDDTGWEIGPDARARRCDCVNLRRLEILGRRPMPTLSE